MHFEIIGTSPEKLRAFYGELFDWQFDTTAEVHHAVSPPGGYGFTDENTTPAGVDIPGGVGGGDGFDHKVLFYVGVSEVEAALQEAERLGGARVLGPEASPAGLVIGQFTDPEGHLIGLAEVL